MSVTQSIPGEPVRRHSARLLPLAAVGIIAIAACGGTQNFQLTLHSRDGSGKGTAGTCEYAAIPEAHTASLDPPFSPSVEGSFARCEVENAETTWVGPGIRSATTPAHSQSSSVTTVEFGEIECGGQRYKSNFFYRWGTDLALGHDSWELVVDDGRSLMLEDREGAPGKRRLQHPPVLGVERGLARYRR